MHVRWCVGLWQVVGAAGGLCRAREREGRLWGARDIEGGRVKTLAQMHHACSKPARTVQQRSDACLGRHDAPTRGSAPMLVVLMLLVLVHQPSLPSLPEVEQKNQRVHEHEQRMHETHLFVGAIAREVSPFDIR